MNLKTYHAYTMAEALAAVKQDLGHDAVILHTRSFKRGGVLGVGRRTVVEVTATPAEGDGPRRPAVARRDAPRRLAAGRAYAPPAAPGPRVPLGRDAASRGAGIARDPAADTKAAARRRREVAASARPVAAAAAADEEPTAVGVEISTAAAAMATTLAPATPGGDGGRSAGGSGDDEERERAGVPVEPVARRYILQPTPPATETVRAAAPPRRPVEVAPPRRPAAADIVELHGGAERVATPDNGSDTYGPPRGRLTADARARGDDGASMQDELAAIRRMVGQVLESQRLPRAAPLAELPPALFDHYVRLTAQDLSGELAERVLREAASTLDPDQLGDAERTEAAVVERLAAVIPVADEPVLERSPDGRPLTIAVVGPTGVGKTTTLAKLAALFKLRRGRQVGLVTADTYRIAAVEQLRTYANIIGLPLEVALTPADIRRAVHTLSDCDVVLVDTAGRSQNDRRRIEELCAFMNALEPHEIHLVLSCTASERVLRQEADAFGAVGADKIAITKLDEAVSFGPIVNLLQAIECPLSFVTTGQEVPDHLEPGSGRRIAELLVGGSVRAADDVPSATVTAPRVEQDAPSAAVTAPRVEQEQEQEQA